ncbi:MAG: type II toxin-antitoxin system VapB family antitoxin [Rubrivivax sp.]
MATPDKNEMMPGAATPTHVRLNERLGVGAMGLSATMCTATNRSTHMRTNIEIDDRLMKDALKATGAKTKREAVEMGLRTLVQLRAQEKARELKGKITWEGDLNAMRTDR